MYLGTKEIGLDISYNGRWRGIRLYLVKLISVPAQFRLHSLFAMFYFRNTVLHRVRLNLYSSFLDVENELQPGYRDVE